MKRAANLRASLTNRMQPTLDLPSDALALLGVSLFEHHSGDVPTGGPPGGIVPLPVDRVLGGGGTPSRGLDIRDTGWAFVQYTGAWEASAGRESRQAGPTASAVIGRRRSSRFWVST